MICPILKKTTNFLVLLALIGGFLLNANSSSAQLENTDNQVTLTAIPPRIGDDGSLKANPGETIQTTIRVRNASPAKINILSQAQDFVIDKDGSTPVPITDPTPTRWSLASWISLAPATHTLEPNETVSLAVVIDVPADALPGGHYAMITHQPNTGKTSSGGSLSAVSQKVGTLVYVFVNGPINEEAYIRNFTSPNFSEYGPVNFEFNVENLSDIHIQPNLRMEITDFVGKKVADLPLESKNIFPLTERGFESKWNQIWGYGHYTATLVMNYGVSGKVAIAKIGFWLFPLTLVIAILLLVLVLIAILIAIKSHLRHRQNDQTKQISELQSKIKELEKQA